ncbi:MAG: CCA tRNA nucleotidyltransferase [Candidatus Sumerlaeia bacterium]|nr:CCA tRNA nucleotidyltransferase [Candidatus Sumerlaeia bacterium]
MDFGNQKSDLYREAVSILERLQKAGHQAWFVGGCVRDHLLGLPVKDFDITTSAKPDEIAQLYPRMEEVGAHFGVSLVPSPMGPFEVASFRHDGSYLNHRHPTSVRFGTLEEDAARRDFTINAIYFNPLTGDFFDPHDGRSDLEKKVLRCVGDPRTRFKEDALRLLRAVRFATRLVFEIEQDTWEGIFESAPLIDYISPERHCQELDRIFRDYNVRRGLDLLDRSGILYFLVPELLELKGVEQGARHHPEGDVWIHTGLVLEKIEPRTTVNCWSALLHDIGKPATFEKDNASGRITFYGHDELGAKIARQILQRLRFSMEKMNAITSVVERHMRFLDVEKMKPSTLRRLLSAPTIEADLALHRADRLGSNGDLSTWEFCLRKLGDFQENDEPVMPPLLLSGRDLIAMGVSPGPPMGELLRRIQDLHLDGVLKTRQEAIEWVGDQSIPSPGDGDSG